MSETNDILDFQLYIDNMRHDSPDVEPPASVPAFSRSDPCRIYQMRMPMVLNEYLMEHIGRGKVAPFVRQAIIEKLARYHPSLPRLLNAVRAILPIIDELFLTSDASSDLGRAEHAALQEAFEEFDQ